MKIRDYPWKSRKLNEFIQDLKAGVSVNSDEDYADGYKYGILKTSCVNNGKFIPTENKPIKIEELEKARVSPQKGRVIISRMNTPDLVGETGFVADDYPELFLPDRMWQTEFSEKICGKWLAEILSTAHFKHEIHSIATGTSNSMKNISKENLLEIKIPFPKYEEQCKQAEVLNTWDCAIELKEKLLKQKKLQKKGLMEQLLNGKVRLSGHNKEWKTYTIGELVQTVNRPIIWDEEFQYKLVSVRRRSEGIFFRGALYGRQILTKTLQPVKEGEFLISKMQILHGALSYVERQFNGMYVSGSYYILQSSDESKLTMQYFDYLSRLSTMYYKAFVSCHGVHVEKMTFNLELYLKEKITIPASKEEQEGIINVLKCIENEISLVETQIYLLKAQKKGLMQLLLTGKVRVPC